MAVSSAARPAPPLVTTPVDAEERLHALDVLRGLALAGMILVHFHQRMRLEVTGVEDLIAWGVWVLVEQKAWGIFAFLFGVGFAVLLRRLGARGARIVPIYLRRLASLAVLGILIQVCFGFSILLEYACWGVVLLLIRRWSTPALLATAVVAACARPLAAELTLLHAWWAGLTPPSAGPSALQQAVEVATRQSDYAILLAARWDLLVGNLPHTWRDLLPNSNLALFCVGMLAVRHRIFDEPRRHVRLIGGWMVFGALAWATSWLLLRHLEEASFPGAGWPLAVGLGMVQDQWLCFTYIGGVVLLLAYRPAWAGRLAPFGRAGRMALTNYLLQAAMLDALSSGYGFGLKLRPSAYVAGAALLFSIEVAVSTWWLARYRFGPMEWAWRTVTYARRQPLRRLTPAAGK